MCRFFSNTEATCDRFDKVDNNLAKGPNMPRYAISTRCLQGSHAVNGQVDGPDRVDLLVYLAIMALSVPIVCR